MNRLMGRRNLVLGLFFGLPLMACMRVRADVAKPTDVLELITEEEAAAGPYTGKPPMLSKAFDAPVIRIESPEITREQVPRLRAPIKIRVDFEPAEGRAIDPESLKLTYLGGFPFGTIDKTKLVKPYFHENKIVADNVSVPKGHHTLRLAIADTAGGRAEVEFNFIVD